MTFEAMVLRFVRDDEICLKSLMIMRIEGKVTQFGENSFHGRRLP